MTPAPLPTLAELQRLRLALQTIAEFPIPEQDNMPAANMRNIAVRALRDAPTLSDAPGVPTGWTLADLHAANIARQDEWCPDQKPDLSFRGNELGGEVGEALNVIKKLERERLGWRGSRDTVEHLAEELADIVICADLCAITADIDLYEAVVRKFNATSEKIGMATRLSATPPPPVVALSDAIDPMTIDYTNYRGERGPRRILPLRTYHGSTEYHPEPQWLMEALDIAKGENRVFAMRDIHSMDGSAVVQQEPDPDHPHLIDGQFQSDKYPTCPRSKVPLSCKDRTAQDLLWEYAQRRRTVDAEFSADMEEALRLAGYVPAAVVQQDGWRPIETAPTDGTEVDLWAGDRCTNCHFNLGKWLRWDSASVDDEPSWHVIVNPSYWMPLSLPPAVVQQEGWRSQEIAMFNLALELAADLVDSRGSYGDENLAANIRCIDLPSVKTGGEEP